MMIVFLIMRFLKCLRVMESMDIGLLRPSILPLAIAEFITVVSMTEVGLGIKIIATLPLEIMYRELVLMGEGVSVSYQPLLLP